MSYIINELLRVTLKAILAITLFCTLILSFIFIISSLFGIMVFLCTADYDLATYSASHLLQLMTMRTR